MIPSLGSKGEDREAFPPELRLRVDQHARVPDSLEVQNPLGGSPSAGRPGARAASPISALLPDLLASVVGAAFDRPPHPGAERMVRRLEAQHEDEGRPVVAARDPGFLGVEQSAVRRVQTRLGNGARGLRGGEKIPELHRGRRAMDGPVLEPHPRLGDDSDRPLRPDEQPVRAGPSAGAGHPDAGGGRSISPGAGGGAA